MMNRIVFVLILFNIVTSRNVPQYMELDEEDQLLLRAAYDSSSYGNDDYNHYQVDEEIPLNKLDLLKDGMWAIKAKIKQMKAFNKALAANLLSTKLQVKEMLAEHLLALKKHHHVDMDVIPAYEYQVPSKPNYPQYRPPTPQYHPPSSQYKPPSPHYGNPQQTTSHYGPTDPQHGPSAPQYGHPAPQYGTPQAPHDPYYGH